MIKNIRNFFINLYEIFKNTLDKFFRLNHFKKLTFIIIIILIFNIQQIRIYMWYINLISLIFEISNLTVWIYKFYYCYLTNTYFCLNFKYIYYSFSNIDVWNNYIIYNKSYAFRKLKIILSIKKKKKKNFL